MFKKLRKALAVMAIIAVTASFCWAWPKGYGSVGKVFTSDGCGSCVSTTKGVYSARHTINPTVQPFNFRVVKIWKSQDIIKIELTDNQNLEKAETAAYVDPDKPVYCVGWIGAGRQKIVVRTWIAGRMTRRFAQSTTPSEDMDIENSIMISGILIPGMSGGGCFQDGKLVGINSMSYIHEELGALFGVVVLFPGVAWLE